MKPTLKALDALIRWRVAQGRGIKDIAEEVERSLSAVSKYCIENTIDRPIHDALKEQRKDRLDAIVLSYRSGVTLRKIGAEVGLSPERIRQMLKKAGVGSHEGGRAVRPKKKKNHVAVTALRLGISIDRYNSLRGGKLLRAYRSQSNSAKNRGIPFEMTFGQWLDIWHRSGKLDMRGCGKGLYCMCRRGDKGPYSVDNVDIRLIEENSSDGVKNWLAERVAKSAEVRENH